MGVQDQAEFEASGWVGARLRASDSNIEPYVITNMIP